MVDIYSILTAILIVSPIVLGIALFGALWVKEEFYKTSFYDRYEDESV